MRRLPTDREILRVIFDEYRKDYPSKGKVHVPIDMQHVARKLGLDEDMLFGRLYYDMGTRLRYRDPVNPDRILASIYEPQAGNVRHVVNFPYLVGKLSELEDQQRQQRWTIGISIGAAIFAAVAAGAAVGQWLAS
jgi:hypothetical protein